MIGFSFKILHQEKKTRARVGEMRTAHGKILTPAFIPVGTQASIKSLTPEEIKESGTQIFFVNTYHMMLRPGADLVFKMGGLHRFMNWNGPLITDSGGFQVFSLGFGLEQGVGKIANIFPDESVISSERSESRNLGRKSHADARSLDFARDDKINEYSRQGRLVKITENGVTFASHLDGQKILLTPEKSIEIQKKLGADIILTFDECTSPLMDYSYTKKAMERTHRWAKRCISGMTGEGNQALFGIIQGGAYQDLREQSAKFINGLSFSGFAIGGSLGRSKQEMHQVIDWVLPLLDQGKPRHLLGIGEITDIFEIIERGIDTFDCVMPTRLARAGQLLTSLRAKRSNLEKMTKHTMDITKSVYADDSGPIDKTCVCYTCQNFSRAYLNHLFRSHELLACRLGTIHNLWFVNNLVSEIRKAILENQFLELKRQWLI